MKRARLTVHTEPISAEIVRTLLLDAGLHPLPVLQSGNVTIAGADQGYYVMVPDEELEAARSLLQQSEHAQSLW